MGLLEVPDMFHVRSEGLRIDLTEEGEVALLHILLQHLIRDVENAPALGNRLHTQLDGEPGLAEPIHPPEHEEVALQIPTADDLVQVITNTFSKHVLDFRMVEIDNLIAVQRNVLLDYVDQLTKKIPKNPSEDDLLKFCLIPEQQVPLPKPTRKSSRSWYFTSPSHDFRFLGGFLKKELTREDIYFPKVGGFPTHAIMLFVGYGAGCMNAFSVNDRLILSNGFHRAYALRRKGIKKIPILIKKIGNADLEFPDEVKGLKKDYLLKHPRPILIKDFFNDDLVRIFKRKQATTVLNINWNSDKVSIDL